MERDTAQRRAIRQVFVDCARPLAPQEVLVEAQRTVRALGIATVYRTIKGLVEEGWLAAVELPGAAARYEVAGKEHHHHFACRSCQRVFDIPGCAGHLHADVPAGFRCDFHAVVIYGLCQGCGEGDEARPKRKARTTR